ncbi:MAG: hypothetical protein WD509_00800 [Candidatus Paceibacterota bacterium]
MPHVETIDGRPCVVAERGDSLDVIIKACKKDAFQMPTPDDPEPRYLHKLVSDKKPELRPIEGIVMTVENLLPEVRAASLLP